MLVLASKEVFISNDILFDFDKQAMLNIWGESKVSQLCIQGKLCSMRDKGKMVKCIYFKQSEKNFPPGKLFQSGILNK